MRGNALLGLTVTSKEGLIRALQVRGSLGCNGHEMEAFRIPKGRNMGKGRITMLDFRKADWPPQGPA